MQVRQAKEDDAAKLLALRRALDAESKFMLLEPGERQGTVEEQIARIRSANAGDNLLLLVAEDREDLVGFLGAIRGAVRRSRHTAALAMGVRSGHQGQGVGTALLAAFEAWAREHGITRLTLTVMTHNDRALRLYGKMGFIKEGHLVHSLRVDGEYVDEYAMARLL